MTSAPVLHDYNPDLPITVTTDASSYAIGAVLEQLGPNGIHPVAFTSRTLNPAEQNCASHELELLAIVDTLRAWRSYLHGKQFVVHTDHYPLRYLQMQDQLSARQWSNTRLHFSRVYVYGWYSNMRGTTMYHVQLSCTVPSDDHVYPYTPVNYCVTLTTMTYLIVHVTRVTTVISQDPRRRRAWRSHLILTSI